MENQQIPISTAAKMVGRDRKSLYRDIKAGRLSVSIGDSGMRHVAISELLRVYRELKPIERQGDSLQSVSVPQPETPSAVLLERRISELEAEREHLMARLLDKEKNLEDLRTTIRLLEYKPEPKNNQYIGFWRKLFKLPQ